jgi:hypothetical protein
MAILVLAIVTALIAAGVIDLNKRVGELEGKEIIERKMLQDLYKDLMEREGQYD